MANADVMTFKDWRIEELTGYRPQTTFYMDFSIADRFGAREVKDTYRRAMKWKGNKVYLTELVMVLNWKIWEHYNAGRQEYAKLYNDLYNMCYEYAENNLKGDDLSYFYKTID